MGLPTDNASRKPHGERNDFGRGHGELGLLAHIIILVLNVGN